MRGKERNLSWKLCCQNVCVGNFIKSICRSNYESSPSSKLFFDCFPASKRLIKYLYFKWKFRSICIENVSAKRLAKRESFLGVLGTNQQTAKELWGNLRKLSGNCFLNDRQKDFFIWRAQSAIKKKFVSTARARAQYDNCRLRSHPSFSPSSFQFKWLEGERKSDWKIMWSEVNARSHVHLIMAVNPISKINLS